VADDPTVTVLINSYNYGHFIGSAIESVLAQNLPANQVEILVVDDGSTDDTAEQVSKFGVRVKYLPKRNGGQASAFNLGYAHSRGEFVALLDADDYFLPGKLRRVLRTFAEHPEAGMVYHKLPELHVDGRKAPAQGFLGISGFLPNDRKKMARYTPHQTSCLTFRRSALSELMPMPESMRIQADLYLELLMVLLTPVAALPEELGVYRIHGNNLCATDVMVANAETTARLTQSTGLVLSEVESWIRAHRQRLGVVNPRRLLDGVRLPLLERQYRFATPSRLRYFWFLCRLNNALSPIQSLQKTILKYLAAFGALILGYPAMRAFYTWCGKNLAPLRS
jgi:glycosyltransferase involved in cell wall biosynthesis